MVTSLTQPAKQFRVLGRDAIYRVTQAGGAIRKVLRGRLVDRFAFAHGSASHPMDDTSNALDRP